MTKPILIIAAALLAGAAPATAQQPAPATASPAAHASGATVRVNGLVCDFCVQAVTRTFRRQPAVADVHVDLDAKVIHLRFKPGRSMPDAAIADLVTKSGYNVVGIERAS